MHKVLMADKLISIEQLDRLLQEGWSLLQLIETQVGGSRKYVFYFQRVTV